MTTGILISGFGGQGLMRMGKIIASAALLEGKFVSWFPSYGAAMRGGTAHCFVKISDKPIASPLVETPDIAVILNQPSLEKFKKNLKKTSVLILNTDFIDCANSARGLTFVAHPFNALARKCGNIRVANSIVLGLLSRLQANLFAKKALLSVLKKVFGNSEILDANLVGFHEGESLCDS